MDSTVAPDPTSRARGRALATFLVVLSVMSLTLTGVLLYFKPSFMAQFARTRQGWVDLHIVMALVMIAAASVHLWFNWKTLVGYLSRTSTSAVRMKRELTLAVAAVTLLTVLSLAGLCPVSALMPRGKHGPPPGRPGGAPEQRMEAREGVERFGDDGPPEAHGPGRGAPDSR